MLNALEACPLNKSDIETFHYVGLLFSSFIKMLRTKSKNVVDQCVLFYCIGHT